MSPIRRNPLAVLAGRVAEAGGPPHVGDDYEHTLVDELLTVSRDVCGDDEHAKVLLALAGQLPVSVIAEATRTLGDSQARAQVLGAIVEPGPMAAAAKALTDVDARAAWLDELLTGAPIDRERLWRDLLDDAASGTRTRLLQTEAVLNLLTTLGGPDAAADAVHWIERASRWWP